MTMIHAGSDMLQKKMGFYKMGNRKEVLTKNMASTHNNGSPLFVRAIKSLVIAIVLGPTIMITAIEGGNIISDSDFALVVLVIGFWIFRYFLYRAVRLFSGSWGERKALSKVKRKLPDGFHIFTNVHVHDRMESDMVVVGPTGVFVLEVKNLNGEIEGGESDKQWTLHKVGQKGGRYSKTLKNPLGQMRRNVYIVSQYLKMENCPVWVEGFVLFPNSNTEWEGSIPQKCLSSEKVKKLGELLSMYPARRILSKEQIEKIAACLSKCQGESPAMGKDEFEEKAEALKKK